MALTTNIQAYWKLDEASGVIVDVVNGHNGTSGGGAPTYGYAGKLGKSIGLDNNIYFNISGYAALSIMAADPASISFWGSLKGDVAASNYMYSLGIGAGWAFYLQRQASQYKYKLGYYDGTIDIKSTEITLDYNNWHHFVIVKEGLNAMSFYMDGSLVNRDTSGTFHDITLTNLQIGGSGGSTYWYGYLDEVGYWTQLLTATEVKVLYNKGSGLIYPFSDLLNGLKAHWEFDEASGAFADSVGSNNGTVSGTSRLGGILGNGLNMNGSSDQASVAYSSTLNLSANGLSISFWCKIDTLASVLGHAVDFIVFQAGTDAHRIYMANSDDMLTVAFYNGTTTYNVYKQIDLSVATWYHIVATCDGSALKIYVNGIDVTYLPDTFTGTLQQLSDSIYLGCYGANHYFDGILDEVSFWDRALTLTEVKTLYNGGMGINYPFHLFNGTLYEYNGATWVKKPMASYLSAAFAKKPIKIYYNSQWNTVLAH